MSQTREGSERHCGDSQPHRACRRFILLVNDVLTTRPLFFVAAGFKPTKSTNNLDDETWTILDQCLQDYPELEALLTSPLPESETLELIDVLKSGNRELKRLAGSKAPEKTYTKDFTLSKKAKLAAAERASSDREVLGAQVMSATQDSLNFTSLPKLVW